MLSDEIGCSPSKISNTWYKHGLKGKQKYVYPLNQDYFSNIDSIDKAYFLGFIGADGCVYNCNKDNKQNIIRISIHKKDKDVLEKFKSYIETDKPIGYLHGKYVSLELVSNKLYNDINKLGLHPNKTCGNTIANLNDKYMRHFIRGYFDGDGSISSKGKVLSDVAVGISGYENNMKKIIEYLAKFNIYAGFLIDKRKHTTTETGDFGQLVFTNKNSKYAFLKFIYSDCNNTYMERKYKLAQKFIREIENDSRISHKEIIVYYNKAVLPLIVV